MQVGVSTWYPENVGLPTFEALFTNGLLSPLISFTRASSGTAFDASGVLQTYGTNVPRLDHNPVTLQPRGLLIEEQRTNSIANSAMNGATVGVIGSGGVAPTGIGFGAGSFGLNSEIIAFGTKNGIPYTRVRIYGTTISSGSFRWSFGPQISASTGQTWTNSIYVQLVSGSVSTVLSTSLEIRQFASGSDAGILTTSILANIIDTPFAGNRPSLSSQLTGASVTAIQPTVRWGFNNVGAVDFTVDVGGPQLEQGGFATSLIITDGAAGTRAADNAIISSLSTIGYNASQGTILADFERISGANNTGLIADFGNGAYGNRIYMGYDSSNRVFANIFNGGVGQTQLLYTVSTPTKAAFSWNAASKSLSAGGLTTLTNSGATLPTSILSMTIGKDTTSASNSYFNGWIRNLTYYPVRLPDASLQQLTQ